jgi:zinc/manganese transport system substrate-binding protein
MRSISRSAVILGGVAAATLALSGCSASSGGDPAGDSGLPQIVASTDVYGDIATQVAGSLADVSSVIQGSTQDPHSYEANARDQLAFSQADIVIENGGGYDDFVETLLDGADNDDAVRLTASDISGYDQEPAEGEFNEHMWYDFPTVQKLTEELVTALSEEDEANADEYRSNGDAFLSSLQELEDTEAELRGRYEGTGVAITEPVPLYMLEASGLVNRTPDEFSEAIEEGTDVSPAVLNETLQLFSAGTVEVLAYNEQTAGPETEQLRAAAEDAGVAVISVTETLPEGEDYLGWMTANLAALSAALA